jgi:hypothetical protein
MRQDSVGANAQVSEEGTHVTGRQPSPQLLHAHGEMVARNLFSVVTQSYLLILQHIAQNSNCFCLSYWSQNGAKRYKSEPAEICLNPTRLRGASTPKSES